MILRKFNFSHIMKLLVFIILSIFTLNCAIAGKQLNDTLNTETKEMMDGGFFLNFGVASPIFFVSEYEINTNNNYGYNSPQVNRMVQSQVLYVGFQPHIELGNQWYFYSNKKWGISLKASWVQLGIGFKSQPNDRSKSFYKFYNGLSVEYQFLKFAPQVSFVLGKQMILDATITAAPTVLVSASDNYTAFGILFGPGARFRYNKFAVGLDVGMGIMDMKFSLISEYVQAFALKPRIYLGFQF